MASTFTFQSLDNFEALPTIRDIVARGDSGFILTEVPESFVKSVLDSGLPPVTVEKSKLDAVPAPAATAIELMEKLHVVAHALFKNLSHALELPWEKYLGDMHEFPASGNDELRIVSARTSIPNEWSTLTMVINAAKPEEILVIFGTALSVFSDGKTPEAKQAILGLDKFGWGLELEDSQSNWIVYYVRPNDDVLYTRTAGALMTPLSAAEYEQVARVRDLNLVPEP